MNSPHKCQWRGALIFICAWTNGWVSNREAGDLRRLRTHYDVNVLGYVLSRYLNSFILIPTLWWQQINISQETTHRVQSRRDHITEIYSRGNISYHNLNNDYCYFPADVFESAIDMLLLQWLLRAIDWALQHRSLTFSDLICSLGCGTLVGYNLTAKSALNIKYVLDLFSVVNGLVKVSIWKRLICYTWFPL